MDFYSSNNFGSRTTNTSKIVNDINVWNGSNSSSVSWNSSTWLKYFISSVFIEYGELLTSWRHHLYKQSCSVARQLWDRDRNPPLFSGGHMNYSGKLTGGRHRQQLHSNLNSRGKWIFLSKIYFEWIDSGNFYSGRATVWLEFRMTLSVIF